MTRVGRQRVYLHVEEAGGAVIGVAARVHLRVRVDQQRATDRRPDQLHLGRLVEGLRSQEASLAKVAILPQPQHRRRSFPLCDKRGDVVIWAAAGLDTAARHALYSQLLRGHQRRLLAVEEVHLRGESKLRAWDRDAELGYWAQMEGRG
jgi:hypothetical protein